MKQEKKETCNKSNIPLILLLLFLCVFFPAALWAGLTYDTICAVLMILLAVHLSRCLFSGKGGSS